MVSVSDLASLRAFVVVADALSFSRAAKTLGVSSSALSQAIRGLEERTGARLLNRTTRSVSLTDAGAALLAGVGPAFGEIGVALDRARSAGEQPTGRVRVHAFRIAAELFIHPLLARFQREHPGIILDLTIDDAVVDMVASGFDAAIRVGEVIERDLVAVRLGGELRQMAVASPDYLARRGMPDTPADLLVHDCLCWRWPGHAAPYRWEFCEEGRWFEVAVTGPLIATDRATCVRAALDGAGIAFAVEQAVAPLVDTGRLVPLLERWSAPFPGFFLCYPQQRQMAPALRAFINTIRETVN
ncbi:LysR family transcriptional regulator [Sphingomonas sp. UYP23]